MYVKSRTTMSYVKTDSEKQAAKGVGMVNKASLKPKAPSQAAGLAELSYGGRAGGRCSRSERLEELLTPERTHGSAETSPSLAGDEPEELSQSEVSAGEVLEPISETYSNNHRKKQLVLTQEFSKSLLRRSG